MNFQNMTYFLEVVKEGNITNAAKRLNISQQALSGTISRLEGELGCRLFDRQHGFSLTFSGRKYMEAAEKMLDLHKQTLSLLDDINQHQHGELRIGISLTRGQALLPLVLPQFNTTHPLVELSVVEANTKTLEEYLDRGDLDVMIGFAPFLSENAHTRLLMRDRLQLVLPKTLLKAHFGKDYAPLLKRFAKTYDLSLFQELPFVLLEKGERIRATVDQAFTDAKISPTLRLATKNMQTALALASEGLGATVSPNYYFHSNYTASGQQSSYIKKKVELLPLLPASKADEIAIGYNKSRYLSQAAKDFIELCIEKTR